MRLNIGSRAFCQTGCDRFVFSRATLNTTNVRIEDNFWENYSALVRDTVIPYQWQALNDRVEGAEPSYAIRNFRIAAGLEEGEFGGWICEYVFYD